MLKTLHFEVNKNLESVCQAYVSVYAILGTEISYKEEVF